MTPPPLEQPQSELSRITNVLVDPRRAFSDIVVRPRWFIPVLIVSMFTLAFTMVYSRRVGWEHMIRQSMDQNSRMQQMPADQREQAVQMGVKVGAVMGYVQSVVVPGVMVLIVGAVLMFVANGMLGTQIRYPQMLGITAYAFLTSVVSIALMIVVMYLKPAEDFDIQNPLAFNAGAFLNRETTPKWLFSIAGSLDLFSFWTIWLLSVGVSVAGRNITVGKAAGAVVVPWLIWVGVKMCWASLFA